MNEQWHSGSQAAAKITSANQSQSVLCVSLCTRQNEKKGFKITEMAGTTVYNVWMPACMNVYMYASIYSCMHIYHIINYTYMYVLTLWRQLYILL